MKNFETLEYIIILEVKLIRIFLSRFDRHKLLYDMKKANIKGKYIQLPKIGGDYIEFNTNSDLILFRLKYGQLSGIWTRTVLFYYIDFDDFKKKVIQKFNHEKVRNFGISNNF